MLTIFAIPKQFKGIYQTIQTNAIKSWLKLDPKPEIILFGDDQGTAQIAKKYNLIHLPEIERNNNGTPIVSDLYRQARKIAKNDIICSLNSDIIIGNDLQIATKKLFSEYKKAFLVSRRWEIDIKEPIDFSAPDYFEKLKKHAYTQGYLQEPTGIDVFIINKYFFDNNHFEMPPFSIGHPGAKYDNWLIWYAKKQGATVIDITNSVFIGHQIHPGPQNRVMSPAKEAEHWINLKLAGGYGYCYDVLDAEYRTDSNLKVEKVPLTLKSLLKYSKRYIQRIRDFVRFNLNNAIRIHL